MPADQKVSKPALRRRSYASPPVIERLVEVHVVPGPTPLETARDALASRWPDFADIQEETFRTLQFTFAPGQMVQSATEPSSKLRFWGPGRKTLYQVAPELFAANDLRPEPGWDELGPMFRRGYDDFLHILQPRQVVKSVVRYLNRVPVPSDKTVRELFKIFPSLPEERVRARAPFQMSVDMTDERTGPAFLTLAFAGDEEKMVYALDFVVESGRRALSDSNSLFVWVEEAHERIIDLFESSVTDAARQIFGERK